MVRIDCVISIANITPSISEECISTTKQSKKLIRNGLPLHSRGLAMTNYPTSLREATLVATKQSREKLDLDCFVAAKLLLAMTYK
ncbi:hypothetical protein [Candidatus Tisiphia endosymbiont of Hybos culiciformis]|uniref:hypothetical protein n=1 Tax=Candidatus Tisiphia endosymbiont of Hybos culiciformis TaxID=3139331 RepID=UPI003CCA712D